jgi:hypothetical protein
MFGLPESLELYLTRNSLPKIYLNPRKREKATESHSEAV